jgi:hypothetical protein
MLLTVKTTFLLQASYLILANLLYHLSKVSKIPATSQQGGSWKVAMK